MVIVKYVNAQQGQQTSVFFSQYPVFNRAEFAKFLADRGTSNVNTQTALLAYHENRGHIVQIRRGLYASLPLRADPKTWRADPYAIASHLAPDAVVGYHSALAFWGKAYSSRSTLTYLTQRSNGRPFQYQQTTYQPVRPPKRLIEKHRTQFDVKKERRGSTINVTGLERTLVDVLDRPRVAGGWEEIWRSLESIGYLDINTIIEYALLLGNATTIAKVGFYLDRHKASLLIEDKKIEPLRRHRPRMPHYLERSKQAGGALVPEWNLIVPHTLLDLSWEENL